MRIKGGGVGTKRMAPMAVSNRLACGKSGALVIALVRALLSAAGGNEKQTAEKQ